MGSGFKRWRCLLSVCRSPFSNPATSFTACNSCYERQVLLAKRCVQPAFTGMQQSAVKDGLLSSRPSCRYTCFLLQQSTVISWWRQTLAIKMLSCHQPAISVHAICPLGGCRRSASVVGQIWWTSTLVVSCTCRTFAILEPRIWISLLPDLKEPSLTYGQFRCSLNTVYLVCEATSQCDLCLSVLLLTYFITICTELWYQGCLFVVYVQDCIADCLVQFSLFNSSQCDLCQCTDSTVVWFLLSWWHFACLCCIKNVVLTTKVF